MPVNFFRPLAAVVFSCLLLSACGGSFQKETDGVNGNNPPVLNDIADTTVLAGSSVTLTGVAHDPDGDTLTYAWDQVSGPAIITPTGASTSTLHFTAPANGPVVLRLVVTDGRGGQAQDDVKVVITQPGNQPPVAVAGPDQTVNGGATVTLDGSGSSDPDGTIATYKWEQTGGTSVGTLNNASTVRASFTAPTPASDTAYTFQLKVTDNGGVSNTDTVVVNVRGTLVVPPTACVTGSLCAGAAKAVVTPSQAHIDGVDETRYQVAPKKQKFNLGGFGINPFQNQPDPIGQYAEQLTIPAQQRVFTNSKGKTEDLWVRVLVLEQPSADAATTTRIAFVTLDATGAGNVIQDGVKKAITKASTAAGAPITSNNILFGQTHTHAGPDLQGLWGGVPEDWVSNTLNKAAAKAVTDAIQSRKRAALSYRQGINLNFNNYRRPKVDKTADSDGTLTLLTATGVDGSAIGSILQYNAHPTSVDETPRIDHPDFILGAMEWLEDASVTGRPGGVALYYNGPIADASGAGSREGCINSESADAQPDHRNNRTYGDVRCRGEGIADAALKASLPVALDPTLSVRHVQAILPVTNPLFIGAGLIGSFNRYYNFTPQQVNDIPGAGGLLDPTTLGVGQLAPTASTTVSRITIGGAAHGLEIVTIPGEGTNTFGQYIRGLTSNKHMMFLGLTHNSFGYIIPEEEFSYVDSSGHAGFVVPFTGYEEFVSLGPLTAPMLRLQAYNPLFDIPQTDPRNLPPSLIACSVDPTSKACLTTRLLMNIDYIQRSYAQTCRSNGLPEAFCSQIDPELVGAAECRANGLPGPLCDALGSGQGGNGGTPGVPAALDPSLVTAIADAQLRGCDMLDPAHCLYPFPSDQFTVPAADGSPQSVAKGGTGKRVNFNIAAMPRNAAGKSIDPAEWNRNDGFSPGSMILTYVPNIGTVKDASGKVMGPIKGAVPLTDLNRYQDANAPILVLDAATGERYPVWAEIDVNAGFILPAVSNRASPLPKKAALIVRPAKNFIEGHRYVVVLRNLKDDSGQTIAAQSPFKICRDGNATLEQIPVVKSRCDELKQNVFPVLTKAHIALDASLYLSWDFTVASAANEVSRLVHMRDDAFASLGDTHGSAPGQPGYPAGRAPSFEVTEVTENPDGATGKTVRRIRGTVQVPSYVVPANPSPINGNKSLQDQLKQIADQCQQITGGNCGVPGVGNAGDAFEIAGSANLPPNRLFYRPDDGTPAVDPSNLQDPTGVRYGDGMPDRNPAGDLTTTFTCDIPRSAISGKSSMTAASPVDVKPVRPTVYGHGLLGSQSEVNGQASDFGNVYGFMDCAMDWYGFATGDLPNVVSVLLDLSNFPVVPDASQQGMLNQMFLARLMVHPDGFAGNANFQVAGRPVFDRREAFYHGNSQGGILGGVLVAASKDINRGVLGVLGMNYSTLLSRSTDFATYSIPLYLSYQDDLDRPFVFALMQMLWDRSENNGYAAHLTDNSAMGGPDNQVLMQPSFGDHQVSMWTADVMARTVGARVDRHRIRSSRHPDVDSAEYALIEPLDYSKAAHRKGSALVPYDQMPDHDGVERWNSQNDDRCDHNKTNPPPIGNTPPGTAAGDDPHECPRRDPQARCQASHFLLHAPDAEGDTPPEVVDVSNIDIFGPNADSGADCPAVQISGAPTTARNGGPSRSSGYGSGFLGVLAQFVSNINPVIAALVGGDATTGMSSLQTAITTFGTGITGIFSDPTKPENVIGLDTDVQSAINRAKSANRDVEAVVVTGAQLPGWSSPSAQGAPYPYPSGANITGQGTGSENLAPLNQVRDPLMLGEVRNAHNGVMLYPQPGAPALGVPTDQIAAYAYKDGVFTEIPVQVDEKYPFFLANAGSSFSVYSGTDEELTYAWDKERWDPGESSDQCSVVPKTGMPDPVAGLDDDDEVVFMAADAGDMAPQGLLPGDVAAGSAGQQVLLADPLDPSKLRYVYLFRKPEGSSFKTKHYVNYQRDANSDQWIDRNSFDERIPAQEREKLGTSNTSYGPNLKGTVCQNGSKRQSTDRFPRDGVSVSTDTYHWRASGRWMVRDIRVKGAQDPKPQSDLYWVARPDLVDRWKGRAFQQSPDSTISLVGFEDEQVNWEANSIILGERCGPVRCIREIWGADSGTNVTKTETFYRDAVTYRFHVRVHPIPPDGLYTSWDYNRGVMIPTAEEKARGVAGGRYYTVLRPQGVPIDGVNDDVGQVDTVTPVGGQCITSKGPKPAVNGLCPTFFDAADPTFNLPMAFDNWEQVSGKGGSGSLVYTFELKGLTSLANPGVVPFYRDDACLDDGTGDDPVPRPWPGEASTDQRVKDGYAAQAGKPYDQLKCEDKQGDYGSNGIHFFVTHDSDNAFVLGKPIDEIDGQQWQFMVPTDQPKNVGETYANVARFPLRAVATPINPGAASLGGGVPASSKAEGGLLPLLGRLASDVTRLVADAMAASVMNVVAGVQTIVADVIGGAYDLLVGNPRASTTSTLVQTVQVGANDPASAPSAFQQGLANLVSGYAGNGAVRAGVAVVDMTPDVGYGAGQYAPENTAVVDEVQGGEMDPFLTHKKQSKSYGVQSRLTARAIVVEGSNGKRVALVKSDNYLAQDALVRRIAQILQQGKSGVGYEQIFYGVTHDHSSTYASSAAAGVAVFQDVFDPRFFENQARKLAKAIEQAAAGMVPVRMGATVVRHTIFKGNVVGPSVADDGTPAGYPSEFGDHGLTVMRFDDITNPRSPKPLAVWINWGEHPESLDTYGLHSADFLGPLERYVQRDLGVPLVYSQGDVGSSEKSGNETQLLKDDGTVCGSWVGKNKQSGACPAGQGVLRQWNHTGYAQIERNVRYLADAIESGWDKIGSNASDVLVPYSSSFVVDYRNAFVPGPLSHPYPSVSNCKTDTTASGNMGVPAAGLPDCARGNDYGLDVLPAELTGPLALAYATAKAEGVPVPDNYDAPSFGAVEENARLKLQTVRLGDVLLASCACEAQVDLILNLESRTNDKTGDIYDGFDWACLMPAHENEAVCSEQKKYYDGVNLGSIPGNVADAAKLAHMRAQIHNDARGWDAPENAATAGSESPSLNQIKGNFTKEELSSALGYKLPVGVGHAGDYNGYTVSYREYMNRDSYRKALTAYGPHTADYMVTRLVRMAGAMRGGPELQAEPHDTLAQADEARQKAFSTALGQTTSAAYDTWQAALPLDVGPAQANVQPQNIAHFNAANFSWRGGNTQVDNPVVKVQRMVDTAWQDFADMTGEVQTMVTWPEGLPGVATAYAGQFAWLWTANFEAYKAFPARLGNTPIGSYRFVVDGCINDGASDPQSDVTGRFASFLKLLAPDGATSIINNALGISCPGGSRPYHLASNTFVVSDGAASRSYTPVAVNTFTSNEAASAGRDARICERCSFRPWARPNDEP